MGALAAGLHAGLLLRPGNAPFEIGTQPDLVCPDLHTMADAMVARFPTH
jgi:2-haloacid dehalogenase